MVKKQAEAMQLADLLEEFADEGRNWKLLDLSADELRRLHALNSDLLESLKKISEIENQERGADWEEIEEARDIADAAIAKATGEKS